LQEIRFNKRLWKKVLQKEDELRSSEWAQNEYGADDSEAWLRDVTLKIQRRALTENDLPANSKYLDMLHTCRLAFENDPEMNKLTVYQRYDRSTAGTLKAGDDLPDAPLLNFDGSLTSLHEYILTTHDSNKPLVIYSASVS